MTTERFDAVAMKQRGAARILAQLKGKTPAQVLEYWQERSKDFRREQQQVIRRAKAKSRAV